VEEDGKTLPKTWCKRTFLPVGVHHRAKRTVLPVCNRRGFRSCFASTVTWDVPPDCGAPARVLFRRVFLVPEHRNVVLAWSSVLSRVIGVTFSVLLVATLTAPVAAAETAPTFTDIPSSRVAEAANALAANDIVKGCDADAFCPERPLRRDQFATILVNARNWIYAQEDADVEIVSAAPRPTQVVDVSAVPFRDVSQNVHLSSIALLAQDGVTRGCEDGLYCPDSPVMRGQLATLLAELFDLPDTDESFFDDLAGHTHERSVNRLAAAGIVLSCDESLTSFCASSPVSRADVAIYVARAMNLSGRANLEPLEDRRVEQAAIDAARAERDAMWDALAQCESRGQWDYDGPNATWGSRAYYGGLQFHANTWLSYRDDNMPRYASRATREQQIMVAERVLARQGWGAWPSCSRTLGFR